MQTAHGPPLLSVYKGVFVLIDIDARRAASDRENRVVRAGNRDYELVPDIKINVMEAAAAGNIADAARLLLVHPDADWPTFSAEVGMNELTWILNAYGTTLGESSASTESSVDTGASSGPTFAGSTI